MFGFQSEKFGRLCWIRHVQLDFGFVLDHEILLGDIVARPRQGCLQVRFLRARQRSSDVEVIKAILSKLARLRRL